MFASDNGPHGKAAIIPNFSTAMVRFAGSNEIYMMAESARPSSRVGRVRSKPRIGKRGGMRISGICSRRFAEIAGTKAPSDLDGMSIVPAIQGGKLPSRPYLYWEFHENGFSQAVRIGNWKGVRLKNRHAPIELYDLSTDLGETNDVAAVPFRYGETDCGDHGFGTNGI